MTILGWVLAVIGAAGFLASSAIIIRANPKRRVPVWSNPDPVPKHSVWTRSVASALIIPGGLLVGRDQWPWLLVFLAGVLVVGLGALLAHNRFVAGAGQGATT